jgi:hypothetical protein|tara:strand:- start:399 stop:1103 length:705 start_codon:yes stop_codon:yes gene_type:complete
MADKPKPTPFRVNNVEALWPRLNTTYRFDNKERRSVPCEVFDDGAKYEVSFRMGNEQAKELLAGMRKAYADKAADSWPEKFDNPFTKEEAGTYTFKSTLKGAYGKDATRKPAQYDAANAKLGDDFLLTTGSTINIAGVFVPYHATGVGTGVSLRLNAVQVTKYVPMQTASPFEVTKGFESEGDNPFAHAGEYDIDHAEAEEAEEIAEPKKVSKKAPAPKAKDPEMDAIVDAWDN